MAAVLTRIPSGRRLKATMNSAAPAIGSPNAPPRLAAIVDSRTEPGRLWRPEGDKIRCLACGHRCLVASGRRGICKVRFNDNGQLRVPYGYVAGLASDPVEKKPFNHVLPGSDALTFGMLGCDFHCGYCQNWVTSQALRDDAARAPVQDVTPAQLVQAAQRTGARLMVSSYNEPLITAEWAAAVFRESMPAGVHELLRRDGSDLRQRGVIAQGLAGDPVLAVRAVKIAPHHSESQRIGSRIDMEERLLLDRITLHARDIAERHAQLAVLIEADPANAVPPRTDETAVPAGDATNPLPLGLPQRSNRRVTSEHICQRSAGRMGLRGRGSRSRSDSWLRVPNYVLHKAQQELQAMSCSAERLSKPEVFTIP